MASGALPIGLVLAMTASLQGSTVLDHLKYIKTSCMRNSTAHLFYGAIADNRRRNTEVLHVMKNCRKAKERRDKCHMSAMSVNSQSG